MAFLIHNVSNVIHTSYINFLSTQLIFYIVKGKQVDIGRVISNKIWEIVDSPKRHDFGFLGLIWDYADTLV